MYAIILTGGGDICRLDNENLADELDIMEAEPLMERIEYGGAAKAQEKASFTPAARGAEGLR